MYSTIPYYNNTNQKSYLYYFQHDGTVQYRYPTIRFHSYIHFQSKLRLFQYTGPVVTEAFYIFLKFMILLTKVSFGNNQFTNNNRGTVAYSASTNHLEGDCYVM